MCDSAIWEEGWGLDCSSCVASVEGINNKWCSDRDLLCWIPQAVRPEERVQGCKYKNNEYVHNFAKKPKHTFLYVPKRKFPFMTPLAWLALSQQITSLHNAPQCKLHVWSLITFRREFGTHRDGCLQVAMGSHYNGRAVGRIFCPCDEGGRAPRLWEGTQYGSQRMYPVQALSVISVYVPCTNCLNWCPSTLPHQGLHVWWLACDFGIGPLLAHPWISSDAIIAMKLLAQACLALLQP
jgi:hypothetical protein